ncbi:MAG: hypothetical protein JW709_03150 [Sedimentisphaerales bacterium]|nr:hypothetical protein [Sedimentisphaerales bacterium]
MFTLSSREVLNQVCPSRFSVWANLTMSLLTFGFFTILILPSRDDKMIPGFLGTHLIFAGIFGGIFNTQFRQRRKIRKLLAQLDVHQPLTPPEPPMETTGTASKTSAADTPITPIDFNNPPPYL